MANGNRPIGWNPLIGVGFTALGVGYLYEVWKHRQPPMLPVPETMSGLGYAKGGRSGPKGEPLVVRDGVRAIKFYPAGDIDQRVGYITKQIQVDSLDPRVISEASAIIGGKCPVERGGLDWCVPPKNWKAEISNLFGAVHSANSRIGMRYTRDHDGVDLFRSSALMRRMPVGDCDDMVIRLGALLKSIGYSVKCRVVAPAGAPGQWAHIYLMVGSEAGNPQPPKWLPLDPTEPQNAVFWEVPDRLISTKKDFLVPAGVP